MAYPRLSAGKTVRNPSEIVNRSTQAFFHTPRQLNVWNKLDQGGDAASRNICGQASVNHLPFCSQDLTSILPYFSPYNSYGVKQSENLVLDRLVNPYLIFSLFSSLDSVLML